MKCIEDATMMLKYDFLMGLSSNMIKWRFRSLEKKIYLSQMMFYPF